ncbi:MAG TPA: LPS-assembly protein LptD [Methylophilaceae bacterium]
MKISPSILTLALFCLGPQAARAEEDSSQSATSPETQTTETQAANIAPGVVVIEGDRMQVYIERKLKATGDAALHRDKQDIYGDTIEYDMQNSELHVIGNTRIEYSGSTIVGPELRLRLDESVGEMQEPSFRMNALPQKTSKIKPVDTTDSTAFDDTAGTQNFDSSSETKLSKRPTSSRGDAKTVLFEGEGKKRLIDARYTTCAADSDDWYIKAKEMELDDYTQTGTARNAHVEFKGVPILYTPWINFSLLNQRQTGFLAPTFGTTSRSGFELQVPFYWNISPNLDATFGTRYLTKRGLQLQGETRYLGENYSGTDNIEYLGNDDITSRTRYYANLKHKQSFGNGWSASYDIERVSDNQYFSDLSTRITATSRVNLPQQGSVNYTSDVWNFAGLVQKYQTLDGISFPYERLPQLSLTGNKDWDLVTTNLYSQWVSFDRNSSSPRTAVTASGGTLSTLVTGSRLTVYPSISLPLARPYGYITPKFGVSYTSYQLDNPGFTLNGVSGSYQSDSRALPIFSLDSGLYFDRNMRVVKNSYTQTLEPRLYYVYVPNKDQSKFPIFDTAESDLNLGTLFQENQFTGNDRINNANQLSLAVTTRMIDAKTGEQRLAATLGQRFYFTDQKVALPGEELRTGNSSDIITAATLRLINKWNLDTAWQYNTDTSRTVKANIGTRYNPEPGKTLNLSYRYTKERLEQIDVSGQWPLTVRWYGVGRYNYSLQEHQPIEGLAGIEYDAGCWQARGVVQRVSTATANANYAIFFQLELGGLSSIGSNPFNLLKRSVPGYTSSGLIPESYEQSSDE